MKTGVSFPIIPATVKAAHKNISDLPLDVFSVPASFPILLMGALVFAVKLKKWAV